MRMERRDVKTRKAMFFARVASTEGSDRALTVQVAALKTYAARSGMSIVRESIYGSADTEPEPEHMKDLVEYLRDNPCVRIVLSCDLKDLILLKGLVNELKLEIHLLKEGGTLRMKSDSQGRVLYTYWRCLKGTAYGPEDIGRNKLSGPTKSK